jgi:hypothetical protein
VSVIRDYNHGAEPRREHILAVLHMRRDLERLSTKAGSGAALSCPQTLLSARPVLFIASTVLVLVAVVIIPRLRMAGAVDLAHLGPMSDQWLAEHRASHKRLDGMS